MLVGLEGEEQCPWIDITIWERLMQLIQSFPAHTFSGFAFFYAIGNEIFHRSCVHSFGLTQLSNGRLMCERDCCHRRRSIVVVH